MNAVAYVGLGSNLEQPRKQVENALQALAGLSRAAPRRSRLYGSTAVGPGEQPDYVNAAAALEAMLAPHALLAALHELEAAQGRVRTRAWTARTLDLDLLLYGDQVIDDAQLTLPHPRIAQRPFVLFPLHDLAPDLHIPGQGRLCELLPRWPCPGVWLL